jgi:dolichol kinase
MRVKADTVVTGRLTKILPALEGKTKARTLPSRNDAFREAIHASGFSIPPIAALIGLPLAVSMIGAVVAVYVISELLRERGRNMPAISAITRYAASQSELCEFTFAPIYFAAGILLALLFFPAPVSSATIAIFALGDSVASLAGSALSGKPLPFNKAKSLEGSLAGFFFAFLASSVFVAPWMALVGAAVAMIVESLPLPVNDNISVPLCTGLALTLLV